MQSTTLVAPYISCEHCRHAFVGAVGKLDGVKNVTVNISKKTVHVQYDPQFVTLAKIEEIMDDIGYTVKK